MERISPRHLTPYVTGASDWVQVCPKDDKTHQNFIKVINRRTTEIKHIAFDAWLMKERFTLYRD